MNSHLSLTKHASGSGGTLRTQVQQITWRESLARWVMAGLQSLWTLKHAGKGVLSLLLVLVGWGVVMPVAAMDPTDGLVLYLPLETDANDHKCDVVTTTPSCTPISSLGIGVTFMEDKNSEKNKKSPLPKKVSKFNTQGDSKNNWNYIQVPSNSKLPFSGSFSLSTCIYQQARNYWWQGAIVSNRPTMDQGFIFGVHGRTDFDYTDMDAGRLQFRVHSGDNGVLFSNNKLLLKQWYHVALVYQQGTATMYIDGKPQGSKSLPITATSEPLSIGVDYNELAGHPYFWLGELSGLRIYDRSLESDEIGLLNSFCHSTPEIEDMITKILANLNKQTNLNKQNHLPEVKNFSVSPDNGVAPLTVTLSATATDEEDDKNGLPVKIQYIIPGHSPITANSGESITVSLEQCDQCSIMAMAIDSNGQNSPYIEKPITVHAANVEPVSCFSPFNDVTGNATELTVEFDAACSRDTEPGTIKKYQWFMNGTKYSEQQKFSFAPTEAGKYVFKLQVTDNEDLPSLDTEDEKKTVTVEVKPFNQPPVADFVVKELASGDVMDSPTVVAGSEVTVDADDTVYTTSDGKQYYSKDPDGTILQYEWKTSTGQTASGKTANLRFEQVGKQTITLTVTDNGGKPATKEIPVVVNKKLYRFMVKDYPSSVKPGQEFEVTLQFVPDEEKPADGVQIYLDFDETVLKAKKVEGFGVLDFELKNKIYDDHIEFAAQSFDNPVPTQPFNLVKITFEALQTAGDTTTLLKFDPTKTFSTFQGKYLPSSYGNDIPITIGDKTQPCQVQWQAGNTRKTRLDIYCASTGKTCATAEVDSAGTCTISGFIPSGEAFICVKDTNSLANKIKGPFSDSSSQIDFRKLLAGDVNGDGWVEQNDASALTTCRKKPSECLVEWHPDVNADTNINATDMEFLKAMDNGGNLDRPSDADLNTELLCKNDVDVSGKPDSPEVVRRDSPHYRKGQRSNDSGQVTFQTTAIPMGLPVGSTFEVQVLVNVDATHSVDTAAVSLNFDPQRLKVNRLTAGSSLDYVLKQTFDNAKGQVNFASVLWANDYPTDTFSLVTINFTLLGENGERTLSFNTTAPRETAAALAGQYVNAPVQPSAIKFAEKPLTYVISDYLLDQAGQPMAGVTIHIGDQTAVTNENGYWKITDLPEGSYTVTAQKDDYSFTTAPCALSREQMDCQMVKPKSLLKLTVDYPPEVTQQQEFDYTITVTNGSPQTVTGVTLTDTLPNGVAALSLDSTTGNGQCDLSTLTCNGFTLDAGASATVKLHVINLQRETLKNTLTVTANEQPAAVKTVTSTVKPDLSVTVKDTPDPVGMQKDLQYEVTVALADQATSAATGVTLELTLPTGVTLKTLTLEQGQCDTTTQLPKVICHLDDLSLEGLQQVPLTLTTSLQDAGLLLLTLQAKLSSNEYATTTVRERTKVFVPPEIKVDLALVIDTTNSMQGEIDGVKAALKKFMATIDPKTAPLVALITFKDEVSVKAFTRDLNVLLKVIDALKAEGGGTCPEASVEALAFTVVHVKKGGQIWFTTDASPYPDADIDGLTKLLQDNETVLNATITGDCSMVDSVNDAQWEDVVNQ